MLCFEVWINGKKDRVVGFESAEEYSVCLTACPEHLPDSVSLEMSGYAPSPEVCLDELRWGGSELRLGDEVLIKIVNQEDADTPIRTKYGEGQIGDADKAMICSNCGKSHLEVERMIQAERITLCGDCSKRIAEFVSDET
jgi:hypothetical protein